MSSEPNSSADNPKRGRTRGQWIAIAYALTLIVLCGAAIRFVWTQVGASYSIEATFHRAGADSRLALLPNATLAAGDEVVLDLECSRSLFVYVLRETRSGADVIAGAEEVALLFPLPGQRLTNPLPPGSHRLPSPEGSTHASWPIANNVALSNATFIVVASPRPVLALESEARYLEKTRAGQRVDAVALDEAMLRKVRETPGITEHLPTRAERTRLEEAKPLSSLIRPLEASIERTRGVWSRCIRFETH